MFQEKRSLPRKRAKPITASTDTRATALPLDSLRSDKYAEGKVTGKESRAMIGLDGLRLEKNNAPKDPTANGPTLSS